MTTALITQSNYIPWRGYFDLINNADTFAIYDEVQYTRRDWRNRNIIITGNGPQWLTIPILNKGLYTQKISETFVADNYWAKKHFKSLEIVYSKSTNFKSIISFLSESYKEAEKQKKLSVINKIFIKAICNYLDIKTEIIDSNTIEKKNFDKNNRLIEICKAKKATVYLSGASAKDYIEENLFNEQGIDIQWMQYKKYKQYKQNSIIYDPNCSILDALFWLPKNEVLN